MELKKLPLLHCPTCYSTNFQVSRVRPGDRLRMLIFQLPVRCRKCNARIYASRSYVKWLEKEQGTRPERRAADKSGTTLK